MKTYKTCSCNIIVVRNIEYIYEIEKEYDTKFDSFKGLVKILTNKFQFIIRLVSGKEITIVDENKLILEKEREYILKLIEEEK